VSDVAADEMLAVVGDPAGDRAHATEPFEDFYRREYLGLVDLARALTGDWAQAQDVVQEAMLVTFGRWDRVRGFDRPGAFARRVVLNRCRSIGRHRLAEGRALARLASHRRPDGELPDDAARFWTEVRKLPRRQRDCVALAYVDGYSTAEIAVVVGCAEPTVRVHLHRGRLTLAQRLRVESEDP
jgi:RNA polymerase sigma factor (sigma-70 family)